MIELIERIVFGGGVLNKLRFMDFCAGIGGGRLGLEKSGMECVGYSEIDKNAINTYKLLYGDKEKNYGDLMKIDPKELPNFDLMIAGFPCQSFSVIGQRRGLNDTRGQVIYGLLNILKNRDVPYFLLENVKGLVNHDKGKTLKVILSEINNIGYAVRWKVLNSIDYGVPQSRERVYLVGIRKDKINKSKVFKFPQLLKRVGLESFLMGDGSKIDPYSDKTFNRYINNKYNKNKHSIDKLLKEDYLVIDTRQSDLRLYRNRVPTLRKGRHGILYVKDGELIKLSGYESLLLQGFPKSYSEKASESISESNLLGQSGNAMTVNTIHALGNSLMEYLEIGTKEVASNYIRKIV